MGIGNTIRRIGFWAIDTFKGGHIKIHYQDVAQIMESPFSEKAVNRRNEILNELLEHSIKTVPFYSKFVKVHFNQFPVIKKDLILDNFNDFKSHKFLSKSLYKVATSGSTGIPFFLFMNRNKRNRNTADTLFFFNKVGYNIGQRLYYLRLWKGEHKNALNRLLQNIIKVDISKMNDEIINALLKELQKDKSSKAIIGIASSFDTLCDYLDKNNSENKDFNIKSFVAISEALDPYTKKSIKKYFKAPVVSRYSTEEQGIIAQQEINDNDTFKINWASYIVEIFDLKKDTKAELGEIGRIVVTDLFNYSMPLIRYDTGDIGVMELLDNELVLTKIEGRKLDLIYDTKNRLVSSYSIYPIMKIYYHLIKQYQFIQVGQKEYVIKLNLYGAFDYKKELVKRFKYLLGDDAEINIEFVDEIPVLSSGKRKKVMNTFKQN